MGREIDNADESDDEDFNAEDYIASSSCRRQMMTISTVIVLVQVFFSYFLFSFNP